jgi:RNA polymerase sigma factor (sigma-70 family)
MGDSNKGLVEKLFNEHCRAVQAFFYRRVRTKADALDLAQEVYVRLLRVNEMDAIRNPEHYLYAVASNLAKEHAALERKQGLSVDIDDATVQQHLSEWPALDGQIDSQQRAMELRAVLEQLTPKCRAAVTLRYRDNLRYQEIAVRLGVSANMVKKYLVQALCHCRNHLVQP